MNTKEKYAVKRLVVNYKTLEEFKQFKEYGIQELSMLEDLQDNIIENDSESPFYGIYFGDKLVARMSLYRIEAAYDRYFSPPQDYFELWKLEVLPQFHGKGYGRALVQFAQSFNLPVKTNGRQQSSGFWEKMGFEAVTYNEERDRGENPYVYFPKGVTEQTH
ncbi:N-acetyltransferase [Fictibacillus enclensis]|uniref:N-acetyltransferase n=1 Tax=Fictibacillus enclensis TaxID=1017270 RepID=UPI0024C05D59|nr:N-acetyltransferase [Fictibacillus enclensis]MDM5198762.1 N-acetyltransferase [Fictibacillus enclensis]MDM5337964.1 N-acetyltransferase [Fictibacillus enclensis]WHY74318.1 N-acetyltransferase [Fictibacillus enclensis]